jgi:hypothetical protein
MMGTAPPLSLTHNQARRLQAYLQTYRRYAFASLMPCTDRNNTLRILQAMQGKLIDVMDQKIAFLTFILATEEMTTLKTIITELLLLHAEQPVSTERNATLADLAALKGSLKGY